jgi:hypothetical protein
MDIVFETDLVCLRRTWYVKNGPGMFQMDLIYLRRTWYVWKGSGMFGTDLVCLERTWYVWNGPGSLERTCYIWNGPGMFGTDLVCLERTWYVWNGPGMFGLFQEGVHPATLPALVLIPAQKIHIVIMRYTTAVLTRQKIFPLLIIALPFTMLMAYPAEDG